VTDLMSALRASIEAARKGKPAEEEPAPKKAKAKPARKRTKAA
jgi:non-homologous end joining protein Ku